MAGTIVAVAQTESTRNCTIEKIQTIKRARALDFVLIGTAECGDIRATDSSVLEVQNPDCPYDIARVGGRYRMTTVGLGWWPLGWRLVGSMVLIDEAPGSVCLSDSWLSD